jgi:hypothetical protein
MLLLLACTGTKTMESGGDSFVAGEPSGGDLLPSGWGFGARWIFGVGCGF